MTTARVTPAIHRSRARRRIRLGAVLVGLLASATTSAGAAGFDFALIGDFPYFPRDDAFMPHLLREIREDPTLRFVIHLGDIHNPRATVCSEGLFQRRFDQLLELGHPFVLTPGDNDWADCKGDADAHLESLRRVFYADPTRANGPRPFAVRPQSAGAAFPEMVENAVWIDAGVVFATLHLIVPSLAGPLDSNRAHVQRLVEAGEAWLDEVFALADQQRAKGVFLATQANLWPVSGLPKSLELMNPEIFEQAPIFDHFEVRLAEHVREFRGPVVLANGDTHYFRVDKPLVDAKLDILETFTRVEGFGSPHGHWVRVRVEPERFEVFSFRQELVPENLFTLVPPEQRDDSGSDPGLPWLRAVVRGVQAIRRGLLWLGALSAGAAIFLGIRRLRRN